MVCDKCEKKLGKVITPDPWKSGARNTVESGGRKVGENKALTANKNRYNPYTTKFETCRYSPLFDYCFYGLFNGFFVGFAGKKYIKLVRIIVKRARTRKVFARCAARK